jgi:hypothetical protein
MASYLTDERRARTLARGPGVIERQLRILRAHREAAAQPQSVTFGFATNEQRKAEQLAVELVRLGHHAEAKAATGYLASWSSRYLAHPTWVAAARSAPLTMEEAALSQWVAAMHVLGETYDSEFTHWRWPAPDVLALNDDYCLTVAAFDGHLDLTIYRWTAATEAALVEHAVDCVSPSRGFGSLQVLARHAHQIRKLRSPSDEVSLADLPLLHALEEIYLPSAPPTHGDYRQLPNLKTFACLDAETLPPASLQHPGLQHLTLHRPRKLKSLNALAPCGQLQSLELRGAPLANLAGIDNFRHLHSLRLASSGSLSDLSALSALEGLEILEIFKAPKLTSLQGVEGLTCLRWIFVHGAKASFDSFGALKHWPRLQSGELLLPATQMDWDVLAAHLYVAKLVLHTQAGFALPDEAWLRTALAAQGRHVRSVQLFPKGECPAVEVTFESPYWRLPELPAGHHRTVVN